MIFNEDYHINLLMSNKDVYIRFDKFRTGEINKVLLPIHAKAIELYKQMYLQESLDINMEFLNNEYE